ncbi:CHAD domain-containing protein [Piscinibacter sakaiensis]|uniref:Adenylate cyclase n=1 Tax=Piscinibacter sakaiensis TaxID=1547922 RepID=A0A0K8NTL0_PISS1|nr:CHAD domain-containing protein [Piscinibacter sakaiensis]GAP33717.1 adenylate cyclase [Piscinibacter sakaiensis]
MSSAAASPIEFELKFQVPEARRRAVRAWVAGRSPAAPQRLQAAYYDTPERALAEAGLALRLRHEGRHWVQTLKGAGDGGNLQREEDEQVCADGDVPAEALLPDPARHAGSAVGQRLLALLARRPEAPLACRYRTDIERLARVLHTPAGRVELAFDTGRIIASTAEQPVCELEIEALDGHPVAVLDVARRWALRHGLWLDTRSKAERGDLLARGLDQAPPTLARAPQLERRDDMRRALQRTVAACRAQVLPNASQVASGDWAPEHVHQLRVGLRRLRSALRLFAADPAAAALGAPLAEPAAQLFRRLGDARDADVLAGDIGARLAQAWRDAAGTDGDPALPGAGLPAVPAPGGTMRERADAVLRDPASQALLLDLVAVDLPPRPVPAGRPRGAAAAAVASWPVDRWDRAVRPDPDAPDADADASADAGSDAAAAAAADATRRPGDAASAAPGRHADHDPAPSLRRQLARRLDRWHRAVRRAARGFTALDEPGRHALRKRIKRLRYAGEFAGPLLGEAALRGLGPLKRAQAVLGELNDLAVAIQACREAAAHDPRAAFALGWLLARREAVLAEAPARLRPLGRSGRPFKR